MPDDAFHMRSLTQSALYRKEICQLFEFTVMKSNAICCCHRYTCNGACTQNWFAIQPWNRILCKRDECSFISNWNTNKVQSIDLRCLVLVFVFVKRFLHARPECWNARARSDSQTIFQFIIMKMLLLFIYLLFLRKSYVFDGGIIIVATLQWPWNVAANKPNINSNNNNGTKNTNAYTSDTNLWMCLFGLSH